jgi:hypothetical protein
MAPPKLSKKLLQLVTAVTDRRPKTVIDHILKHGFITTQGLKYGYNHPPRAAKDVREQGIPLETFRVRGGDGRSIAAYRFGDLSKIRRGCLGGRRAFPKGFKAKIAAHRGTGCCICLTQFEERYLQIDHRVPYEVVGDVKFNATDLGSYMLVCGSCNRAKSWSCEHCQNCIELKSPGICMSCYWAWPESYAHIAMRQARRLDLVWLGSHTATFDSLKTEAKAAGAPMPEYVKAILRRLIAKPSDSQP